MNSQPRLVQCEVCGNYYDANSHSTCPVCSQRYASDFSYTVPPKQASHNYTMSDPIWNIPAVDMVTCSKCGRQYDKNQNPQFCPCCEDISNTVGWLLAVSGSMRGYAFNLHSGYNYIGREIGDVRLTNDLHVARQNHAVVIYTEKDDVYQFESSSKYAVGLNGEEISEITEIYNGDILEVGSSMLMFIALADTPEWVTERGDVE